MDGLIRIATCFTKTHFDDLGAIIGADVTAPSARPATW